MTISLSAAEQIGNGTVFGFGFTLVFVGLICIILICSIVGALCKRFIQEEKSKKTETKNVTPAANVTKGAAKGSEITNKGELVAAVSAAIAEDLGTDVTGIRINSIKKL